MSPVYSYVTFAAAKQQLANRLFDSTKQFWNDGELGVYIKESMRTWNALTAYWRNDFTFPSQQNVTWYDLTDTSAMPGTLRPYTLTDADIYTAIQYHLLEPVGPISPWTGVSAQFTADDVINATLRRRDELLSVTGCTLTRRLVPAVAGRIALPDTVIDVRRMAYIPPIASAADNFNRPNQSPLGPPWVTAVGSNSGQVVSGAWSASTTAGSSALYNGIWSSDQSSQATLVKLSHGTGYAILTVRGNSTGTPDNYALVLDGVFQDAGTDSPNDMFVHLFRGNRTVGTAYVATAVILGGPKSGDVYKIQIVGNVITAFRTPVGGPSAQLFTYTDTNSYTVPDAGPGVPSPGTLPGLAAVPSFGVASDIVWDDWSGNGIFAAAASVIWPDDAWSEQSFNRGYLQQPSGVPSAYLLSTEPPISFDVDAVPPPGGNYELLTVETSQSLLGLSLTLIASDDFNRADQNPIGAPWVSLNGSYVAGQIRSNQYIGQDGQFADVFYDGGITWPADQYSKAVLRVLNSGQGVALSVRVTVGSPVANGNNYALVIGNTTGIGGGIGLPTLAVLNKAFGGTNVNIATGQVTPQVGDVFMITAIGGIITGYQNGVVIPGLSVADADVVSGNPGIGADPVGGVATDIAWDDWEGGLAVSSGLLVPDDWVHVIKWGALADLLSRESNAKDPLRAAYCEQRYRMGLALLASAPALLAMRIGNEPLQVDAVRAADQYQTTWQAAAPGTPATALHAGLNKIALSPAASAGPFSLTATVVQNAPVPTVDGDPLQVARDDLDVILDYAQHLAAFKMGGQEFLATIPLLQRFMKKAEVYGLKLAELGEYTSVLYALSQRENQMNPRMAPEPPDNGGSGGGNG